MKRPSPLPPQLAIAVLAAAPLGAQVQPTGWIGDDGFDVGCCEISPALNLPEFPSFSMGGRFASIENCALENVFEVRVETGHYPVICDLALLPLRVTPDSAGAPGWLATLVAKYARTWVEVDDDGFEVQVWRWLVNTDAIPVAGSPPSAQPPHPPGVGTHFTGHVDYAYALDPQGGEFRMAMNLNHLPGCISHNVLSAYPMGPPPDPSSHHDRSYHLAAPDTFVFTPVPQPAGFTMGESVRSTVMPPLPYLCLGEADLVGGQLFPGSQDCLCPGTEPAGPFLWDHGALTGSVTCGPDDPLSTYVPLPLIAPAPPLPTGFVGFPVGLWVGTDSFPATREVTIYFGVLQYADHCYPGQLPVHIVSGVATFGRPGFGFHDPGPWTTLLDLQDMVLPNGLLGPISLGFGSIFVPQVVWNLSLF